MRLDRDSFIHALECLQLDVRMEPSRFRDDLYDLAVSYGSSMYTTRIDCVMFHDTTVHEIAIAVLGRCTDCGNFPVHPNVRSCGGSLCRHCEIKGGDCSLFRHTFDLDKLRQRLGPEKLRMIIQTCSWEGPE